MIREIAEARAICRFSKKLIILLITNVIIESSQDFLIPRQFIVLKMYNNHGHFLFLPLHVAYFWLISHALSSDYCFTGTSTARSNKVKKKNHVYYCSYFRLLISKKP